jgi:hypothetical protein
LVWVTGEACPPAGVLANNKMRAARKGGAMRLFRKTSMGMALVAAVEALRLLSGSPVLTASEKDVIVVNTPAAPVPVTGVVEVVNDALYQTSGWLPFSSRGEPRAK